MKGLKPGARRQSFTRAVEILNDDDDDNVTGPEITKLLDQDPGLINEEDEKGWTLLHHAVRNYQYSVVELLLGRGANPNSVSGDDQSPLGLCRGSDEDEVACRELLLAKGARRTPREEVLELMRKGRDAEIIAAFKADPELMNAGHPTLGPYLHVAARYGQSLAVLEFLLSQGVDPNVRSEDSETALHVAYKNPAAVRILLEHGADINARDDQGYTALHYAVGRDKEETATLLVEAGADLNIKTNDGETVLDFVLEMHYPGYRQLARYLKEKGARSGKSKG